MPHSEDKSTLKVSELDFDTLRDSLKEFLSAQPELLDYDFEGSTTAQIIDILAYNTYHNSFYSNMIANEMFLETAVRRENVVSRAKQLSYTPRSSHGATAYVNVTIEPSSNVLSVKVPKNEEFTTTIDGVNYTFVTPESTTVPMNNSGTFTANLEIVEGTPLTHRWTVNTQNPKRYVIPNQQVDTRSIDVKIQNSDSDTTTTTFTKPESFVDVTSNSNIYFLQETTNRRYEIYFGDGILGKALENGNIVIVDYRVCNEDETNGANIFTPPSDLGGHSFTVNSTVRAAGGDSQESVNSIRFNASNSYESQNRAVTTEDYKAIIKNEFGDVQSVSIWGGEDNDPPKFGTVFVSIKPKTGNFLSDARKDSIVEYLNRKSILSINPVITDPRFLFIVTRSLIKYNPNATDGNASDILSSTDSTIKNYENEHLGQFGASFIHSNFVDAISDSNDSITSVQTSIGLQKKIDPRVNENTKYDIKFNHPIVDIGYRDTITSTRFEFEGRSGCKLDMDENGTIRVYFLRGGIRTYLSENVGFINFSTGRVSLTSFNIESFEGESFNIEVIPKNLDADPSKNLILLLNDTVIDVYDTNLDRVVASSTVTTEGTPADLNESGILNTAF